MFVDLKKLYYEDVIFINDIINIDSNQFQNEAIKALKNLIVKGKVYYNYSKDLILELNLKGIMVLEDAYSLELIDFPLDIDIEEVVPKEEQKMMKNMQNNENILDITDILWQNIVLEVPISYSKDKHLQNISGEGWELVNEKEKKIDPRLAKLAELLDEGKE